MADYEGDEAVDLAEVAVGDVLEACWTEDDQWYTAEVLETDAGEAVLVEFVEYGNQEWVTEPERLRWPLPEEEEARQADDSAARELEELLEESAEAAAPAPKPAAANKKAAPSSSSSSPPSQSHWSQRRTAAAKRRAAGATKNANVDYDADESIIHGIENIDVLMENAECELFARLEKLESITDPTAEEMAVQAATLCELAVLPVTPEEDANKYWSEALALSEQATATDPSSAGALTQAAHIVLRRGLYLQTRMDVSEKQMEDAFAQATELYRAVFGVAPVRIVLKFIVHAQSKAASLTLHHFLGVYNNGYSGALMRSNDELNAMVMAQRHADEIAALSLAGVGQPLFRARCFGVLKCVVLGYAVAVTDDLPEDQAWLLLALWDAMVRMEKVDEAVLTGFYLLKLHEEVDDMEILLDAIDSVRDYTVTVNYNKLAESVQDAIEAELTDMANAELEEVLATMAEYDPDEVLQSLREMQAELTELEYKHNTGQPALRVKLSDVSFASLFEFARSRHHISQFLAARAYLGMLSLPKSRAKVCAAICKEFDGPRVLATLCCANRPEVAQTAACAMLLFVEQSKGQLSELASAGIVEACIYLLSHEVIAAVIDAAACLAILADNADCLNIILALKFQFGPAALDLIFSTDAALVESLSKLLIKVFRLTSADDVEQLTLSMIPDVVEEDLTDIVEIIGEQLPAASARAPSKAKKAQPLPSSKANKALPAPSARQSGNVSSSAASHGKKLPTAKLPKAVSPSRTDPPLRGRGFTQKVEAKYANPALVMSPSRDQDDDDYSDDELTEPTTGNAAQVILDDYSLSGNDDSGMEIQLDAEAEAELERELADMDAVDTTMLSEMSQIEAEQLEDEGEDERAVSLLKMGAVLEEEVNDYLDDGLIDEAEDFINRALAKYQALLLLTPHSHVGLRRMADALLRKAEFREGSEADALYARAISYYDTDIAHHASPESQAHKVAAMIDRAKNKAAEEDAKGGGFNQTRKLLSEAKQASHHVQDGRDEFIESINEVLTYVRLQTDARREEEEDRIKAEKAEARKSKPLPSKAAAAAAGSKSKGSGAKHSNPDVMLRKGSMAVASAGTKKKPKASTQMMSEKERLEAALAQKKPITKIGKLSKEGGGKSLLGRKTWKERLFELSESSLEYYEKNNKTEKPKGVISLHEITTVRSVNISGRSNCFEVVTESRRLPIEASSEKEKEDWVKAIVWNVDRVKLREKVTKLSK